MAWLFSAISFFLSSFFKGSPSGPFPPPFMLDVFASCLENSNSINLVQKYFGSLLFIELRSHSLTYTSRLGSPITTEAVPLVLTLEVLSCFGMQGRRCVFKEGEIAVK